MVRTEGMLTFNISEVQRILCPFVEQANGEAASLSSLNVSVYETPISYPPGAVLPVYGDRTHHTDITHGRPGGHH